LLLPNVRLLTLTGTGGVGKTRLALQVAAEALESFPDGVFLIDLARLNDPALIPSATATALGLQEQHGKPLLETLADYLRERQILLLFDNFEHVLPAATFLADLLVAAPNLKVMVTSRARLGLLAEHEYQVETLPVPNLSSLPSLEELESYDAIDLFAKRAQVLRPNFSLTEKNVKAVAEIVCRLEGLPLAIELAAAWVKILSPEALLDRLDRRLATLVGGARDLPARQRTLRDTIAWSHDLLPSEEQILFRRLSVFVGGWSLEGMEAVSADACDTTAIDAVETLSRLIDQSLVETRQLSGTAELRYIMLESIREFAGEKLEASGEATHVRAAFEQFLIDLAAKAEDGMRGPEQIHWLNRLEEEHNNIRAALRNAVDRGDGDVALSLASRLWEFWRIRGFLVEGSAWVERALELAPANAPELRAAGEYALGKLSIDLANYEAAEKHFRNSADLWQARGDQQRVVDAKNALVIVKLNTEEFEEGRELGEEALRMARLLGDEFGSATALFNLGLIARSDGRLNEAVELLDEALTLWRAQRNPKWIALTTQSLGITHRRLGHVERARAYLTESREICERLNNLYGLAVVASELGLIEEEIGHHDRAIAFHLEATLGFETVGAPLGILESLEWIGVSAANTGQAIPALQLFGAAAAARRALRVIPMSTEAPFINAGIEAARERAGAGAEDALRSGSLLTLQQAHKLALSLAGETVLHREGDAGGSLP
jgi:predicted ATPase